MKHDDPTRTVTVAIPVRNGEATIAAQLEALRPQAGDCHEIVVVDNGSTDGTIAVVESFIGRIPNLRLVDAAGQRGVSNVRNLAAASTVGDLLFCDADDVVAPGWIRALAVGLDDHDIVGGAVDEYLLNGPSARPRTCQSDALPIAWDYLAYSVGANSGFRREVLDSIDGWNPHYDGAGEDIDVCWRAQHAGFDVGFVPSAVVHYRHRTVLGDIRRQQIRYGRAAAKLHRDYRALGLRRGPWTDPFRSWGKALLYTPVAIVRPAHWATVHTSIGYAWGTLTGMFIERAWPF